MTPFLVVFNSISVISERWEGDNGRLCAMKPRLLLERFQPGAGLETGSARPALYLLSYRGSYMKGKSSCADGSEF